MIDRDGEILWQIKNLSSSESLAWFQIVIFACE